jgi:hypothetical protein
LIAKEAGLQFTDFYLKPVSEELVQVGLAMVPKRFTVHLVDLKNRGPDIELTFEVRGGRHECREARVVSPDDPGREVRSSDLCGVRIDDALEMAMRVIFYSGDDEDTEIARGVEAEREVRKARAARKVKITDALLREVARVYKANVSHKPTEAVATHFDRQHRTAALYVKRARERGFLGPAIKGKAGEQ